MAVQCKKCQSYIPNDSIYCPYCAYKQDENKETPSFFVDKLGLISTERNKHTEFWNQLFEVEKKYRVEYDSVANENGDYELYFSILDSEILTENIIIITEKDTIIFKKSD
jgi:hypothetical protein